MIIVKLNNIDEITQVSQEMSVNSFIKFQLLILACNRILYLL